ncbi:MAG: glucose-6-phosphate isomerase [Clostridia bacterium]|nr:glucose-6-phosphate isomerase [Clostridia bacterium]
MRGISVDFEGLKKFVDDYEFELIQEQVANAHSKLENKSGLGNDYLGWLDLPESISEEEVNNIKKAADKIRKQAEVLVVIGIGGSYLGAKAVIDMLSDPLYNLQPLSKRRGPQVLFVGNSLSGKYLRSLIEYLRDKDVAVNVISKSGKTIEPAVAFRIFKLFMEEKYGISGARERIYVTTDENDGILRQICNAEEYTSFVIPKNVGGRYSVLSPVGLLPMAVAGINFEDVLDGALFARHMYNVSKVEDNDCYKYAAARNILYSKGKDIELLTTYEPTMQYFGEWFKQLFGESEGKDRKGIFPASCIFTTDLHSMGQLIQEGKRNIFETVLNVENVNSMIKVPEVENSIDELDYLENKELDYINKMAMKGTYLAHVDGMVPTIQINVKEMNEYNVGQLIFFFEKACGISGYLLGVNPFNQPGVEAYKKNMMKLLKED